jgi:iron(III) transport system permease protein
VGAALALVLIALVVGVPLAELARVAAGDGLTGIHRALSTTAVVNTLVIAVAVTVLAVGAGTGLALAVERRPTRSRRLARLLVASPLVVPEFVLGFAWTQAYGPAGLSDRLLHLTIPGLYGPAGIVLVLTVHAVPLAYLAVAAGLAARADPVLERAARASGATRFTALRTVTLPLLRVPLLAAATLVFVSAVNSFGIPQVLGTPAGFRTMSTLVYTDLVLSADPGAFADLTVVALAMVVLVLIAVGPLDFWLRGPVPGGRPSTVDNRRGGRAAAGTVAGFALVGVGVPMLTVLLAAITRGPGLLPLPRNWTMANFSAAFSGGAAAALGRSVWLAAVAAALAPALGALVAAASHRPLGTVVTLSFAVPGSALAVGILIGYGRWLAGSAVLILVAYLAKFWALGHRPVQAALDRLPRNAVAAARSSGAGPTTAWRTVVLPRLGTALAAGAVLVFLFSFHELTMSTILYGPGSETFGVVILNDRDLGGTGTTAALAVVQSVPVALIALLLPRFRPGAP